MKKFWRAVCIILIFLVLVAGSVIGFLSVDEYDPADIEDLEIEGNSQEMVPTGETIRLMTWNLGYGALGDNADFFMDGGKMVYTADKDRVQQNLDMDIRITEEIAPDILCVQELDRHSDRSYFVDESEYFIENSEADVFKGVHAFATNFKVALVPLPIPPIGKVLAGIEVFSRYQISEARRLKLHCPFSWPLRTFNLKRCLEVTRMPVENSDKELVIVNLHLEAYDSGEGKIAQANMLKEVLASEIEKGNYVIAAGDFNQVFSNVDTSNYPVLEGMWEAGVINVDEFDPDLNFYADETVPSCRSLDRALSTAESRDPADFQYYIIDGIIASSNVKALTAHTQDYSFVSSDHNPVIFEFVLE
jgi:endonuclease/exonuclease/phosphatase family metal-dependent hydrolase